MNNSMNSLLLKTGGSPCIRNGAFAIVTPSEEGQTPEQELYRSIVGPHEYPHGTTVKNMRKHNIGVLLDHITHRAYMLTPQQLAVLCPTGQVAEEPQEMALGHKVPYFKERELDSPQQAIDQAPPPRATPPLPPALKAGSCGDNMGRRNDSCVGNKRERGDPGRPTLLLPSFDPPIKPRAIHQTKALCRCGVFVDLSQVALEAHLTTPWHARGITCQAVKGLRLELSELSPQLKEAERFGSIILYYLDQPFSYVPYKLSEADNAGKSNPAIKAFYDMFSIGRIACTVCSKYVDPLQSADHIASHRSNPSRSQQ